MSQFIRTIVLPDFGTGGQMSDSTVDNLVLDLLSWLANRERTYRETIDAWRTSRPRLPVWEEANDQGLVALEMADGKELVRLTEAGQKFLAQRLR